VGVHCPFPHPVLTTANGLQGTMQGCWPTKVGDKRSALMWFLAPGPACSLQRKWGTTRKGWAAACCPSHEGEQEAT
jgi:hypothetical protein